jgi:hypothetical protein
MGRRSGMRLRLGRFRRRDRPKPLVTVAGKKPIDPIGEKPDRPHSQHLREESTFLKMRKQLNECIKTLVDCPVSGYKKGHVRSRLPYEMAQQGTRFRALIGEVQNPMPFLLVPPLKSRLGGHAHAAFAIVYQDTCSGTWRQFGGHASAWQTSP